MPVAFALENNQGIRAVQALATGTGVGHRDIGVAVLVEIRDGPSVDYPEKTTAVAERHTRVICNISRKRYALDFWSRASEIKPVAAEVLLFPAVPTAHKKVKKSTKPVFSP